VPNIAVPRRQAAPLQLAELDPPPPLSELELELLSVLEKLLELDPASELKPPS
jgi:hypothetical protein